MWLGEQVSERGIGNGISLVIFAGIVVAIPSALSNLFTLLRTDQLTIIWTILLLAFMVGVVGTIVFFERSQRRVPIQYSRRVVGRKMFGGGMTYFPLRINTSGVIPPIFASSRSPNRDGSEHASTLKVSREVSLPDRSRFLFHE